MPRSAALCALLCGPVRHSSVAQYAMLTSTVLVKFSLLCTDEVMNFFTHSSEALCAPLPGPVCRPQLLIFALWPCVPCSVALCAISNF